MEQATVLSTNKILAKVTLLAPFRDLRIELFPELSSQSLEQFSSSDGYYLFDPIPPKPGLQPNLFEEALKKVFGQIFRQELSELAVPIEHWPDVDCFETFCRFILAEQCSLIADLGDKPLVTTRS